MRPVLAKLARGGGVCKSAGGELPDLKKQLKDLASDVLEGKMDRGAAAVVACARRWPISTTASADTRSRST